MKDWLYFYAQNMRSFKIIPIWKIDFINYEQNMRSFNIIPMWKIDFIFMHMDYITFLCNKNPPFSVNSYSTWNRDLLHISRAFVRRLSTNPGAIFCCKILITITYPPCIGDWEYTFPFPTPSMGMAGILQRLFLLAVLGRAFRG